MDYSIAGRLKFCKEGTQQPESPSTPDRQRDILSKAVDSSPSNTHFSCDTICSSVFDDVQKRQSISKTPTSGPLIDDSNFSDISANTDHNEEGGISRKPVPGDELVEVVMPETAEGASEDVSNRFPYKLLSGDEGPFDDTTHGDTSIGAGALVGGIDVDSNMPQIVCILSCVQCILADLPCSRTLPSCSRCIRNGYGDLCLLQRRKTLQEVFSRESYDKRTPVLLKVRDEDEAVWERKQELHRELHQTWCNKEDRKNWVLPTVEGKKRNFSSHQLGLRFGSLHLGEGKGQLTHRELLLA